MLSLVFWGLSSPVGSSPDDDFHLASIWCGMGERPGVCEQPAEGAEPGTRVVPHSLVTANCYADKSDKSASCQGPDFGTTPEVTVSTGRGNFNVSLYPPVYYFTMSLFVGPNVDLSVIVMRIVNSVIFVGLGTALFLLLPFHRRAAMLWGGVVALVPFGMFLIPSTNPSGWAIASAVILGIALIGYLESSGRRKVGLGTIAALATVIGAGARADAASYSGLAIVCALAIAFRRERRFLVDAILPLCLAVVSILFYFSAGQSRSIASDSPYNFGLALTNFLHVPSLWTGAFGGWGLGWLDTAMPPIVWVSVLAAFCLLLSFGLGRRLSRKGIIVTVVFAAVWLVPTAILTKANMDVGQFVQPRYILPLIVMLGTVALLQDRADFAAPSRAQLIAISVGLSVANAVALFYNIRRYVSGAAATSWNLDSDVQWWWDALPLSPVAVWALGSVAFAAMLVLATAAWNPEGRVRFANTLAAKSEVR
jgi:hypothetical protein